MRQQDAQPEEEASDAGQYAPRALNYEPRSEHQREPMGPSDRAAWIIAAIIIFFILSFLGLAITQRRVGPIPVAKLPHNPPLERTAAAV